MPVAVTQIEWGPAERSDEIHARAPRHFGGNRLGLGRIVFEADDKPIQAVARRPGQAVREIAFELCTNMKILVNLGPDTQRDAHVVPVDKVAEVRAAIE